MLPVIKSNVFKSLQCTKDKHRVKFEQLLSRGPLQNWCLFPLPAPPGKGNAGTWGLKMTIHISSLFTKAARKFGDCQLLSGWELFPQSLASDSLRWASNAKRTGAWGQSEHRWTFLDWSPGWSSRTFRGRGG